MKPIVKDENQTSYNAYEINLKINDETFSHYYMSNLIRDYRIFQVQKALDLYLSNKPLEMIKQLIIDDDEEIPYCFDEINKREDLLEYARDMMNGEYDFPDDYIDTELIDGTIITHMEDTEQNDILFPHDKKYI